MMTKEYKIFLFFILQCLVGTAIGFTIYQCYPVIGTWTLFSIILVLAPDRNDAMIIATNRIKANLIGALIGLSLCYLNPVTLPMICIGIAIAMVVCEWLKLSAVAKSAIVAILIITMHEPEQFFWAIALERAGGVMLGCIIGVLLTYVFHIASTRSTKAIDKFNERFHRRL